MMSVLSSTDIETLLAVVNLADRSPTITVRDVAAYRGRTVSTTHAHLWVLRNLGLVEWTDGQSGTLRPTVRRVPF